MSATTRTTVNHEVIRLWAEDRGAMPASVAETSEAGDVGVLRFFFPGQGSGDQLQEISWDEFFGKFEEANLSLIYEVLTSEGSLGRFCKFISRA